MRCDHCDTGAGPAGSPGALLQLLALVTRKNTAMHRKLLDLKEALFRAGAARSEQSPNSVCSATVWLLILNTAYTS